MKLNTPLALFTVGMLTLAACDARRQAETTSYGTDYSAERGTTEGTGFGHEEEKSERYHRGGIYNRPLNENEAERGPGAVEIQKGSGAVEEDNQLQNQEREEQDKYRNLDETRQKEEDRRKVDQEERPGTKSGTGATRYLDNTSAEPDLTQQDKGIPIGTRDTDHDFTSSKPDQSDL